MGVPQQVQRRQSVIILSPTLTEEQLTRMLTHMRATLVAFEVEIQDPLAHDWQDRAWNELESVRETIVELQRLIRHASSSEIRRQSPNEGA